MDEENDKPETDGDRLNRQAMEYWQSVAAKGGGGPERPEKNQRRRVMREPAPSRDPIPAGVDETDPAVIIIRRLEQNTDIMSEALAEAKATRQAIAESDRQTKRLADTAADNMRMLNRTVENFSAGQAALDRAKSHNLYWGIAGFFLGMTVLEAGTIACQHMFGS
jgi:hypothetical protein